MHITESTVLLLGALIIIALATMLAYKIYRLRELGTQADDLKKSLEEVDGQAKLIVRTDIELNKIQEELDKKISGLYALQKLSRLMSMTMEEGQIFRSIQPEYLEDLGFEQALAFLWDDREKQFVSKLNVGYAESEAGQITAVLNAGKERWLNFIDKDRSCSSLADAGEIRPAENIAAVFKAASFVISPILAKQVNKGFLLVGTQNTETLITEGDEELIKILSTQLSQALENARLFEKTWHAQQALEKKVFERTRELTLALEEVKKISSRKTEFVSSVSHELRTPLTSVKGYAAILLAGKLGSLPAEARERIEKINRHSDELVHMVNDLLDISRIESGRAVMNTEPCDLKETLLKIEDLLSGQLKEKKIYLSVDVPEGARRVMADKTQLERVFINLIGNAMKFTPAEGKISIHARKAENMVEASITDTGCGIAEHEQDKIFEEFFRVDNPINQTVKGTGLGLALVKHIIEAHRGRIRVKSKPGEGATFSFTLPQG